MNKENNRGSEWRKWDLHVHTTGTLKNDQFEEKDFDKFCETFFKKALKKDISVIGVTDYFNIDNYKKVLEYQKNNNLSNFNDEEKERIKSIFILPNVECRISLHSENSRSLINIHFLFNPSYVDNLDNEFFNKITMGFGEKRYPMNKQGITNLGKSIKPDYNEEEQYKAGIGQFAFEISFVENLIADKGFRKDTLIVVSNSSKDGASGLQEHDMSIIRGNIYKLSDAIFSSNVEDRKFFLGLKENNPPEDIRERTGSLKPCIHGSDAHTEDELFNPDDNKFCWIKADPTFEGLKQIIYEPSDRVMIQELKPKEEKTGYHVIKSVKIQYQQDTHEQSIELNHSLNTIIGGRSTGKSTLLRFIAYKIDENTIEEAEKFVKEFNGEITWQDNENNNNRDIEFFPQNHMYEIAKDAGKKNKLIKSIIKGKDPEKYLDKYDAFCSSNEESIQKNIDDLFKVKNDIEKKQEELKTKGDKQGVEKEIEGIETKLKALNNDSSSKDDLHKFEELRNKISENEEEVKKLENAKSKIEILKDKDIINRSICYEFNNLYSYKENIEKIFDEVSETTKKEWQTKLEKYLHEITDEIETIKKINEEHKSDSIYEKGLEVIKNNKQYSELSEQLQNEKIKLEEINNIIKNIESLDEHKDNRLNEINTNHIKYFDKITGLRDKFLLKHEDIEIKIEQEFKEDELKGTLEYHINLKTHKIKKYIDEFIKNYQGQEKRKETVKDFLYRIINNQITLKQYRNGKDLSKAVLTKSWFTISYNITYDHDIFETMSEGKKAFVILKLLLEFSNKKCPILIDQPEDNLDNRNIYSELVTYIKNKKKQRQIILVTHNANVVVNADAENVIIANQHGDNSKNKEAIKFQYINGSLENTFPIKEDAEIVLEKQGIREHVCEILEGGENAFNERKKKYNLSQ